MINQLRTCQPPPPKEMSGSSDFQHKRPSSVSTSSGSFSGSPKKAAFKTQRTRPLPSFTIRQGDYKRRTSEQHYRDHVSFRIVISWSWTDNNLVWNSIHRVQQTTPPPCFTTCALYPPMPSTRGKTSIRKSPRSPTARWVSAHKGDRSTTPSARSRPASWRSSGRIEVPFSDWWIQRCWFRWGREQQWWGGDWSVHFSISTLPLILIILLFLAENFYLAAREPGANLTMAALNQISVA